MMKISDMRKDLEAFLDGVEWATANVEDVVVFNLGGPDSCKLIRIGKENVLRLNAAERSYAIFGVKSLRKKDDETLLVKADQDWRIIIKKRIGEIDAGS